MLHVHVHVHVHAHVHAHVHVARERVCVFKPPRVRPWGIERNKVSAAPYIVVLRIDN